MENFKTLILNHEQIENKITRIAYQIYEKNYEEKEIVLVGISDRGFVLAKRIHKILLQISSIKIKLAELTIDKNAPQENNKIKFSLHVDEINNQSVVLVDDVLNSGKTLIYGIRYLLNSQIKKLKTVVLVDRSHKRFPVQADFVGLSLSTTLQEHINVEFNDGKDGVYLC